MTDQLDRVMDRKDHGDTSLTTTSETSTRNTATTVFLTLGDGDFSYSLDLARYLASTTTASAAAATTPTTSSSPSSSSPIHHHTYLVATGIDSLIDLTTKYKDTPYILRQLQQPAGEQQQLELATTTPTSPTFFSVSIHYGVNAIVRPVGIAKDLPQSHPQLQPHMPLPQPQLSCCADHVIFHHPHLGTENAVLHAQFLAHLFHSVTHHWMKQEPQQMVEEELTTAPEDDTTSQNNNNNNDDDHQVVVAAPVFHLTLVAGQYERWKCSEAAQKHGMILLGKRPFVPPPLPPPPSSSCLKKTHNNNNNNNAYQYRRHQSGKSFGSRRPTKGGGVGGGSITYTFGRRSSINHRSNKMYIGTCLPWQRETTKTTTTTMTTTEAGATKLSPSPAEVTQEEEDCTSSTVAAKPITVLSCPYCNKVFHEGRSRKCHIRDKHKREIENNANEKEITQGNKKAKTTVGGVDVVYCPYCQETDETRKVDCRNEEKRPPETLPTSKRSFSSDQALQDHIRAKHSALHTYIAPDWSRAKQSQDAIVEANAMTTTAANSVLDTGNQGTLVQCHICGCHLHGRSLDEHWDDFVPTVDRAVGELYKCSFCSKTFREERAKLQHENFCSKRLLS